jgi:transposase
MRNNIEPMARPMTEPRSPPRCSLAAALPGVIANKVYDKNALRQLIGEAGTAAIITSLGSRKILIPHDAIAYKLRDHIERFFNKLKLFRHIVAR